MVARQHTTRMRELLPPLLHTIALRDEYGQGLYVRVALDVTLGLQKLLVPLILRFWQTIQIGTMLASSMHVHMRLSKLARWLRRCRLVFSM